MTDKSFSDYPSRNVMKNPLLSTAVTGLSIEDLTHNAMLLPVSLSQEAITRPDQEIRPQTASLRHSDHVGDANPTPIQPPSATISPFNPPTIPKPGSLQNTPNVPIATQSKASLKSNDDDFDVNEYFARLHGTRYVSAPLNSNIKEENPNLEATEENLEEINLNEPEKDNQHSITADIAQNFSQLPTVLPQVASAVFSSFSNMLQTRRSRDPTPVDRGGYQEVQFERPVEEPRELLPPPREPLREPPTMPPSVGTANYRLPSKKKYAQIPGLSSNLTAQNPLQTFSQNVPVGQQTPQYFIPGPQTDQNVPYVEDRNAQSQMAPPIGPPSQYFTPSLPAQQSMPYSVANTVSNPCLPPMTQPPQYVPSEQCIRKDESSKVDFAVSASSVPAYFAPLDDGPDAQKQIYNKEMPPKLEAGDTQQLNFNMTNLKEEITHKDLFATQNIPMTKETVEIKSKDSEIFPSTPQTQYYNQDTNAASNVIPPPPTFSNAARRDSSTGVEKTILPPSVARRLNSNHPIIKQTPQVPVFTDTIFVPAPVQDNSQNLQQEAAIQPPSAFTPFNMAPGPPVSSMTSFAPPPLSASVLPSNVIGSTASSMPNPSFISPIGQSTPSDQSIIPPPSLFTPSTLSSSNTPAPPKASQIPTPIFSPERQTSIADTSVAPPPMFSSGSFQATSQTVPPSIFTPTLPPISNYLPPSAANQAAPPFSLASNIQGSLPPPPSCKPAEIMEFPPVNTHAILETQQQPTIPVPEPPKAIGNVNFRLTKKRPQYYAGPIEGIGAISNSVKPVLSPVETGSFQGALFTPQSDNFETTPANVDSYEQPALTPFDISRPIEVAQIAYDSQQPPVQESQFNTAFDMSRPTTESYDEPKQVSSGFGLLGSLKSKLSSIDINKIQSSVTTFFDPAYNQSKCDGNVAQENTQYGLQHNYGQDQSHFDVFVPNVDQSASHPNYQQQYQTPYQEQYNYGQDQYYQNQNTYNYYQNQLENVGSYFADANQTQPQSQTDINVPVIGPSSVSGEQGATLIQGDKTEQKIQAAFDEYMGLPQYTPDKNLQETAAIIQESSQQSYTAIPPYYSPSNATPNVQSRPEPKEETSNNPPLITNVFKTHSSSGFFDKEANTNIHIPPIVGQLQTRTEIPATSAITSNNTIEKQQDKHPQNFFDDVSKNKVILPENNQVVKEEAKPFFKSSEADNILATRQENPFDIGIKTVQPGPEFPKMLSESAFRNYFDKDSSNATGIKFDDSVINEAKRVEGAFDNRIGAATNVFDKPTDNITLIDNRGTSEKEQEDKHESIFKNEGNETQSDPFKLQTNPADFFTSFQEDHTKTFPNISESGYDNIQDNLSYITGLSDLPRDTPELNMSSAPLSGLSSMLADKTKELHELENEMNNMTVQEPTEDKPDTNAGVTFFEHLGEDQIIHSHKKNEVADWSICETCREVNLPDLGQNDLTKQLIENITSPIQLTNPVEVPLTESNTPENEGVEFDSNQCAEISHITEETIEVIQVQSATELLEADQKPRDYGWAPSQEHDYSISKVVPPAVIPDNFDYNIPINPGNIGFFGGISMFENAPTNIGEEVKDINFIQKTSPIVLPRQMSIPTAPPEEDDTKSEGIDVHSIEEDASKDFPIFEEYVIEPSAVDDDDDDIVLNSDKGQLDSFTSRVDKYQKKEEPETVAATVPVMPPSSTSPALPIASYFDTGNYAAEAHYRNSLSSPTFGTGKPMRVPPGFEEQYAALIAQHGNEQDIPDVQFIPETSTQTRPTFSPSFSTAHDVCNTVTCYVTNITTTSARDSAVENVKLPDIGAVFGGVDSFKEPIFANVQGFDSLVKQEDTERIVGSVLKPNLFGEETSAIVENLPPFDLFGAKEFKPEIMTGAKEVKPVKPTEAAKEVPQVDLKAPLPDPINFFGTDSTKQEPDEGINRLASYFASPVKTDQTKSFFELSQSQNHYRQENAINKINPNDNLSNKNVVDSQTKFNLSPDQYVAHINLMHDLVSPQNTELKPDQTFKTVNYFTVEYENESFIKSLNKGEPDHKKDDERQKRKKSEKADTNDDKSAIDITKDCNQCCDLTKGCIKNIDSIKVTLEDFKVKKCMDENREPNKSKVDDMETKPDDGRGSVSINFDGATPEGESNETVTASENRATTEYSMVKHHWFYRVDTEDKSTWRGFSASDNIALENAYNSADLNENTVVPTDGGRYDVNIKGRLRYAVYWNDKPANVRRCSWFYKGNTDARYVPYTEEVAEKLEVEYRHGMTTGEWHRRLVLPNSEMVVMHGPAVMVHFVQGGASDAFSAPPQSTMRPRVVRRGHDESEIEEVEPSSIDHLLLLCHGVGSACDMRFRNVEEVVDDFRSTSLLLLQSHYKNSYENGIIGRVEVLPISWHASLHSGEAGVDRRLARITLDSIPRLRTFTNDTVLDVLFYTSPVFCQTIINTVCEELNRIYTLFKQRNPEFKGGVSLGGHSLGSVILYDLLCHQVAKSSPPATPSKRLGSGGVQPTIQYPELIFHPDALYALGSPIAIFECIRGVEELGAQFRLPTCDHFFNIFHPYDPIAYRIEPLINPTLRDVKPSLIPHHKGRKRMHLELKETMARVGADLKQKLLESLRNTWTSVWKSTPPDAQLSQVVEEEMEKEQLTAENKDEHLLNNAEVTTDMLGSLNSGRRVDYVLQEAPFEMINEYIFAMSSHVCYWESEDTMLLMLREIYDSLGVRPDCVQPQHTLTVNRTRVIKPDDAAAITTTSDRPSTSRNPS